MPFDLGGIGSYLTPMQIGAAVLAVLAIVYLRRAGILLWRLGAENRKLRQGIRGYAQMEQDHIELGRENRERNRFHGELPILISNLTGEKTVSGIGRQLVDFTGRSLGASEASLFLVEAGSLVFREGRGIPVRDLRIRIGEGRIGAVAQFRRIMAAEDFQNLDAGTRYAVQRSAARIDTVLAAPLVAHGRVIGVLNVGGNLNVSAGLRKEILLVIAHLGATALENQINFERLEREATTDGLTGLSNVRNFKEKMRQELARSARFGRACSVFLFDIDNFKHYNDRNGHPAGDECLRMTGELLRKNTRVTDLPARYGGEEFVVLLPETDRQGALAFAEKIRSAIAGAEYPFREKQPLGCVSISGGVASFPEDGKDVEALVRA
ncbi:MAG: GGDEF domain-containing protein, partial [Candidatus Binatia bacterium]